MKHKVQEKEDESHFRPELLLQLEAALEVEKYARNKIMQALRGLEDGDEVSTFIHLEEALVRFMDVNHEVVRRWAISHRQGQQNKKITR